MQIEDLDAASNGLCPLGLSRQSFLKESSSMYDPALLLIHVPTGGTTANQGFQQSVSILILLDASLLVP